MTNNIPLPTDFLEGFKKGKLPKSNMEVFLERTRKPKQPKIEIPIGTVVEPPPHIAELHKKMLGYILRKMTEKGLDISLWNVRYEHTHQGAFIESRLKIGKHGLISNYEKETLDLLLKELDKIPQEVIMKIMDLK